MTRFTAITAALLLTAGMASAQDTTAVAVGGEIGIPGYPTSVIGANGVPMHVVRSSAAYITALQQQAQVPVLVQALVVSAQVALPVW